MSRFRNRDNPLYREDFFNITWEDVVEEIDELKLDRMLDYAVKYEKLVRAWDFNIAGGIKLAYRRLNQSFDETERGLARLSKDGNNIDRDILDRRLNYLVNSCNLLLASMPLLLSLRRHQHHLAKVSSLNKFHQTDDIYVDEVINRGGDIDKYVSHVAEVFDRFKLTYFSRSARSRLAQTRTLIPFRMIMKIDSDVAKIVLSF